MTAVRLHAGPPGGPLLAHTSKQYLSARSIKYWVALLYDHDCAAEPEHAASITCALSDASTHLPPKRIACAAASYVKPRCVASDALQEKTRTKSPGATGGWMLLKKAEPEKPK